MSRQFRRLVATIAVLALLGLGCGKDSSAPTPAPGPTATRQPTDGAGEADPAEDESPGGEHRQTVVDQFAASRLIEGRKVELFVGVPSKVRKKNTDRWMVQAVFRPPGKWRLDFTDMDDKANTLAVVVMADETGYAYRRSSGAWYEIEPQSLEAFLRSVVAETEDEQDRSIPGAELLAIMLAEQPMTQLEALCPEEPVANLRQNTRNNNTVNDLNYRMFGPDASVQIVANLNSETDIALTLQRPGAISPSQRKAMQGAPRVQQTERPEVKRYTCSVQIVGNSGNLGDSLFKRIPDMLDSRQVIARQDLTASPRGLAVSQGDRLQLELLATLPDLNALAGTNAMTIWSGISRRPIPPPGNGVQTQADVDAHIRRVVRRDTLDLFVAHARKGSPGYDEAVAFLTAASQILGREVENTADLKPAIALGQKAIDAGCRDLTVISTFARVAFLPRWEPFEDFPQNAQALALLKEYDKQIADSEVMPPYVKVINAESRVWCQRFVDRGDKELGKHLDMRFKNALAEAAAYPGTRIEDFSVLPVICKRERSGLWTPYLLGDDMSRFERVRAERGKQAWYLELEAGLRRKRSYFDMSGSDRGLHLAEDQARRLNRIMQYAREPLMASHEHWPADPRAAETMITVAMATSNLAECRYWFEEAVAAQMDSLDAYDHMGKALWPEWHGDPGYQLLYAFAQECLNTGQFDTAVPGYYAQVGLSQILQHSKNERFLQSPLVKGDLRRMSEGYMRDGKAIPGFEGQAGLIAYIHFMEGRYDEAAAIAISPAYCSKFGVLGGNLNPDIAYAEIRMHAGAAGVAYRKAKQFAEDGRNKEAEASLREAVKLYQDRTLASYAIDDVKSLIDEGTMVETGGRAIPLVADSQDLKITSGKWRVLVPEGAAADQDHPTVPAELAIKLPNPPFRLEGEIHFEEWPTKDLGGGLSGVAMQPSMRDPSRMGPMELRQFQLYTDPPMAFVHIPRANEGGATVAAPIRQRNTFRLDVWHGASSLSVNGQPVAIYVTNRLDPKGNMLWALAKMGSHAENPVAFHNLRVMPLQPIPEDRFAGLTVALSRLDAAILDRDAATAESLATRIGRVTMSDDLATLLAYRQAAIKSLDLPAGPVAVSAQSFGIPALQVQGGTWQWQPDGLRAMPGADVTAMMAVPVAVQNGSIRFTVPRDIAGSFGVSLGNVCGVQDVVATLRFDQPYAVMRSSQQRLEAEGFNLPPGKMITVTLKAETDQLILSVGNRQVLKVKRSHETIFNTGSQVERLESIRFFGLWARPRDTPTVFTDITITPGT